MLYHKTLFFCTLVMVTVYNDWEDFKLKYFKSQFELLFFYFDLKSVDLIILSLISNHFVGFCDSSSPLVKIQNHFYTSFM